MSCTSCDQQLLINNYTICKDKDSNVKSIYIANSLGFIELVGFSCSICDKMYCKMCYQFRECKRCKVIGCCINQQLLLCMDCTYEVCKNYSNCGNDYDKICDYCCRTLCNECIGIRYDIFYHKCCSRHVCYDNESVNIRRCNVAMRYSNCEGCM